MINFVTTDESHFSFDEFRREIVDYDGAEKNVVIPTHIDGMEVISIGPDAFWNKGLRSIVLPPTLSVIGFYAFAFNELTDVRIPPSVSLIEDGAFMYNKLEVLRLGENHFSIPHSGFRHNKLSRLVLPENTQEIHSDAFGDNPLTDIVFEGAPTFIHRHAFNLGTEDMAHVKVTGTQAKNLRVLLNHHAKYVDAFRALAEHRL
ncbi:leucine-rich repeat domain-containing protein [Virgibacillus sp. AGTR]|uniref:leucine-rich repeat domain-containing protein n=1 Tax=Virgibacillus sp. AGTR TaxID=2812055 RepID=UPI001D15F8B0|nr:leucine-rich repeat domain-containing protein [Virgibacillus sp. AGTR]MCC2252152.1 leucine-rich repeat domain-containing protein [Virgibacillus sp. AGTR]